MPAPVPRFSAEALELFLDHLRLGEASEFEALCRAHADHADELRGIRARWEAAGLAAGAATGHQPLTAKLRERFGEDVDPGVSLGGAEQHSAAKESSLVERLRASGGRRARYRMLGEVARGGMGAILKIWDDDLRRALAMKVVLGKDEGSKGETPQVDAKTLGRFLEEAQITGQLDHPGIVPVHELGLGADGRVYFTMRLVKGQDLRAVFELVHAGDAEWNQTRALGALLKVCEALSYAHAKGVIHRDLKPANVMVGKYGEVYVMDWGLARVLGKSDRHDLRIQSTSSSQSEVRTERRESREETPDSPLVTMDGDVVGTPSYMSPEQARGELEKLGPRSDVYALGSMLYHLIGGEMPYVPEGARVSQRAILTTLLERPPRPLLELAPRAPAELIAICEKAMRRDLSGRYGGVHELAGDLRAYLEGRVVTAYETGTWAETRKWVKRNKPLAAALAAAMLAILAGSISFAIKADEATALYQALTGKLGELYESNRALAAAKTSADERTREARQNLYTAAVANAYAAHRSNEPATVRRALDLAPEELRNWEWRHADAISDTSLIRLEGHTGRLTAASFSPDGSRVVTASQDKTARIWDSANGKELARLEGHTDSLISAEFSPDGTRVLTASHDKTARTWDATSGKEIARFEGHSFALTSAMFSPDGSRIVTASLDATARVWNSTNGEELVRIKGHELAVESAVFSPDGARVVTASWDQTARTWDSLNGNEIAVLRGHTASVKKARFSPDGSRVLTVSTDRSARIWDSDTGKQVARAQGSGGAVWSAEFRSDGKRIVTASSDRTARIWDVEGGNELVRLEGHDSGVDFATFSPDGKRVVTASEDASARVWDSTRGIELARLDGHKRALCSACFSRDGSRIVTASLDNTARIWDVANVGSEGPQNRSPLSAAVFSPDGTLVVTAAWDNAAHIHDSTNDGELAQLQGHTDVVNSVSFSPDGARVVSASKDKSARIWSLWSLKELVRLDGHTGSVDSAAFSPDGTRVVTASDDKTARVWDAASGKELTRYGGHSELVYSAVFSSDGRRVLSASYDDTACIWDAASSKELLRIDRLGNIVHSAAFSPDGTLVVLALWDGTARVWSASTGKEVSRLEGHTSWVNSATFSPDGKRVVTAALDNTARVWDPFTGQELARLAGHSDAVNSAVFSSDGTRILTASFDGTTRIWDSVPHRVRYAEGQALISSIPAGQHALDDALSRTKDPAAAAELLRKTSSLSPVVRHAALDLLLERVRAEQAK